MGFRGDTREGYLHVYKGAMKSGAYFDSKSLPKVNGQSIKAIWCPCEFTKDERVVDAKGWSFTSARSWKNDLGDINRLGFLPEEFKALMGKQTINGMDVFVRNVWFRVDSSGHASEDDLMTIYVENNSFHVWNRKEDYKFDYKYSLTIHDPYVKKWLDLFEKELTVKHPKRYYWEFEKLYPKLDARTTGTKIQTVNEYIFPDLVSKHWKGFNENPIKHINDKQLIMFDETKKQLIYMTKVEDFEIGDWGLINLYFSRDNPHYARIGSYNGGEHCKYVVHSIKGDDVYLTLNDNKPIIVNKRDVYKISFTRDVIKNIY